VSDERLRKLEVEHERATGERVVVIHARDAETIEQALRSELREIEHEVDNAGRDDREVRARRDRLRAALEALSADPAGDMDARRRARDRFDAIVSEPMRAATGLRVSDIQPVEHARAMIEGGAPLDEALAGAVVALAQAHRVAVATVMRAADERAARVEAGLPVADARQDWSAARRPFDVIPQTGSGPPVVVRRAPCGCNVCRLDARSPMPGCLRAER
jgi:hypothetical protein